MVLFFVYVVLGVVVIGWIVLLNLKVFIRLVGGLWFLLLECVYYVVGIVLIVLGWYFNICFV